MYDEVLKMIAKEVTMSEIKYLKIIASLEKDLEYTQNFAHKQAEEVERLKKEINELTGGKRYT